MDIIIPASAREARKQVIRYLTFGGDEKQWVLSSDHGMIVAENEPITVMALSMPAKSVSSKEDLVIRYKERLQNKMTKPVVGWYDDDPDDDIRGSGKLLGLSVVQTSLDGPRNHTLTRFFAHVMEDILGSYLTDKFDIGFSLYDYCLFLTNEQLAYATRTMGVSRCYQNLQKLNSTYITALRLSSTSKTAKMRCSIR
ncbi:hypothetical protein BX666DRAFT_2025455 [Dichotomocladium elegans]|nr:hypothetical protein BX666DRAFT_2025455 [Dichotomocladium elegans]